MELVKVEIAVPKETKEAIDVAAKVVKLIVEKKFPELLTLVGELAQAVQGSQEIPAEISSEHKAALAAYAAKKIVEGL